VKLHHCKIMVTYSFGRYSWSYISQIQ